MSMPVISKEQFLFDVKKWLVEEEGMSPLQADGKIFAYSVQLNGLYFEDMDGYDAAQEILED
jgi:hypothetical protein